LDFIEIESFGAVHSSGRFQKCKRVNIGDFIVKQRYADFLPAFGGNTLYVATPVMAFFEGFVAL